MIIIGPKLNKFSFKSYKHEVKSKTGDLLYRGDTCMFRHDLAFDKLIEYMNFKYNDASRVNVIIHACSDGEEVYSFIAKLLDSLNYNDLIKFLPIKARDINKEHINKAKEGKYIIESFEKSYLDFYLGDKAKDYFDINTYDRIRKFVKVNDNLKNFIKFRRSDILSDIQKMNMNNTVLFARNLWPYLPTYKVNKAIALLADKMDKSSTLIIGDFDKENGISDLLVKNGFIESKFTDNVYEINKPRNNSSSKNIVNIIKNILQKAK